MDNKHKIVNHLGKHPDKKYTMHELSNILHIPYASFYRAVQQMNDLLDIEVVGKSKIVNLKLSNPIIKAHLRDSKVILLSAISRRK